METIRFISSYERIQYVAMLHRECNSNTFQAYAILALTAVIYDERERETRASLL